MSLLLQYFKQQMLLFAIILTISGILNLADTTSPKLSEISFKTLLDLCTEFENNSKDCQYFISTYRWQYDDVRLVFKKVLEKNRIAASPAENILEARLISLIESPTFNSNSVDLNLNSLKRAIKQNHESLAIAIWLRLIKSKNDSSDVQLQVCSNYMGYIMEMNMLQLLKKMVTERPDCLNQVENPIDLALDKRCGVDMVVFLLDYGVEITLHDIDYLQWREKEIFAAVVRKYPFQIFLKSISDWDLMLKIWKILKEDSNELLQLCSDTIIYAVNSDRIRLVKLMHQDFPECILSKGDILMDIAISGGMSTANLKQFLNERGVEITPGLVLREPSYREKSGYRDMILLLNDIGVEITPEHLQHLSTYEDTSTFEWARLTSQLSKETFINSPIKKEYLESVLKKNRFDLFKEIVDFKVFKIKEIMKLISLNAYPRSEREKFIKILNDSKTKKLDRIMNLFKCYKAK